MLIQNLKYRGLLSEAATADMMATDVSSTVKDTVEELNDALTTNIELVPEKDMATNRADLQLTPEMCLIRECSEYSPDGKRRFMLEMNDVIRLCEEEEAQAVATGADPSTVDANAASVVSDVADTNEVPDNAEIVVVVNKNEAAFIAETAMLESKCGRVGTGTVKLIQLTNAIADLQEAGIEVIRTK